MISISLKILGYNIIYSDQKQDTSLFRKINWQLFSRPTVLHLPYYFPGIYSVLLAFNDLFTLHTKKMAWCWKGSSWKAIHILFLFQIAACVDDRIMDPPSPREIISLPKKSTKNTLSSWGHRRARREQQRQGRENTCFSNLQELYGILYFPFFSRDYVIRSRTLLLPLSSCLPTEY